MSALSEALRNLSTEDHVAQMYLARAARQIEALERDRDALRAALENIIPRFERCIQCVGSPEENAKLATEQARAALATGTDAR